MKKQLSLDQLYEQALNISFRLLSFRSRSEKEIRDALKKKKYPDIVIDQTIQKLGDLQYLNDDEFAKWWIDQRKRHRPKSKYVIKQELKQKGISDEIIEKHLSESINDLESAKQLVEKKKRTFARYTGDQYNQKVSQFLQRRGFGWDIIKEVLKDEKETY